MKDFHWRLTLVRQIAAKSGTLRSPLVVNLLTLRAGLRFVSGGFWPARSRKQLLRKLAIIR
jgi:hypothetical protein